jgi:branched-chain amino acid transport system ATP-binding protein
MSGIILKMDHVQKNFGGLMAIDDFNSELPEGKVHGLIGPNGAGKTTIFNTITGIYAPSHGHIYFNGDDITGAKPHIAAALGIGRTFQNIRLFQNLSVLQNIITAYSATPSSSGAASYSLFDALCRTRKFRQAEKHIKEQSLELLDSVGLLDKADERAANLPYGHQRKLEIARALAIKPKLLLLDEPAAGMNAAESTELIGFVKTLREKFSLTILMIEHHMDVVSNLCDTVTVLNFGKTICSGAPGAIKKDPRVIAAYLGKSGETI